MNQNSAEVADLVIRVAAKDRDAFRQLYSTTSAKLFAVGFGILKDRHDAEAALQEVFIKIWSSAWRYNVSQFSVMSWLIVVARNTALDRFRARRPAAMVELEVLQY